MHEQTQTGDFVKVQFYEPDIGYENLWASPHESSVFRIESVPFFVYRVSMADLVEALPDHEGRLQFKQTVQKGGHRTLRVRTGESSASERNALRKELDKVGCVSECLRDRLISVDVPPNIDLTQATSLLETSGLEWEYADPVFEELIPGSDGR